jgi:hypothetical protein
MAWSDLSDNYSLKNLYIPQNFIIIRVIFIPHHVTSQTLANNIFDLV